MRVVGIIQARLSSTRLPGKVLLPLAGRPVLWHVVHRLRTAHRVDDVIVATSTAPDDDAVAAACTEWGVDHVRGSLDDVLGRFCLAIRKTGATAVVRVPADKPLVDADAVDEIVAAHIASGADYTTNMGAGWPADRSCPFGLELEVAAAAALLNADAAACTNADREHVMPYLYRADHGFKVHRVPARDPFAPHTPRLNLDTPEDYEVIRRIYDALASGDEPIRLADVRELLAREPDLAQHNASVEQRGLR
jgi:spore coat polysaccharide biosynthesis protein SpsF